MVSPSKKHWEYPLLPNENSITGDEDRMGIETGIGLIIGVFLIWVGYIARTKGIIFLLAGFWITWEPVNNEKLGNSVGILFIILGVLAILTAIFSIWFGAVVGKISAILALIDVIVIFIVIGLDQMGR